MWRYCGGIRKTELLNNNMKATLETTTEKPLRMCDLRPGDIAEILEVGHEKILIVVSEDRHATEIGCYGRNWGIIDVYTFAVRRLTPGEKIVIS